MAKRGLRKRGACVCKGTRRPPPTKGTAAAHHSQHPVDTRTTHRKKQSQPTLPPTGLANPG
eukprot:9479057-Pyramimonas_sp.AAC.1